MHCLSDRILNVNLRLYDGNLFYGSYNMKYLIAGLGNIGIEYAGTRHNIGFWVADSLARKLETTFSPGRYASVASGQHKGRTLVIIKPATFMNLSGKAVKYWLTKEKILAENLLVILDDLDLEPGVLRMKKSGSGGSHNGMNHIIETLGSQDVPRLRIGIGSNFPKGYQSNYVLGQLDQEELKFLTSRVELAVEMVLSFVSSGIGRTMNLYNNR